MNRLTHSTSPYLQQHKDNPVDWFEWGEEAFEAAKDRDLPILLSVGYAACHWCHVMAHESFEDEATAALMNARFINIKVDREERPDVDAVYMQATQALSGSGGWPMTVFLDHERRPFYAGTYFPPTPMQGMPSFTQLLEAVHEAWMSKRDELHDAAARISREVFVDVAAQLRQSHELVTPDAEVLDAAVEELWETFDAKRGGFGSAPKFPPAMALEFLMRNFSRTGNEQCKLMIDKTCEAMARGGLFDHLSGGFARYSVDSAWVVPHFEKMLYDNALLLRIYLHWWRITGSPLAIKVVRETADFLVTELRTRDGGFASSLDADSLTASGTMEEGAFYVWHPRELEAALGERRATKAQELFHVTPEGTFEHGASTLQLLKDPDDVAEFMEIRAILKEQRDSRPRPQRDDKVIASWNGLAIAALAEAGLLLDVPEWLIAAHESAQLLIDVHKQPNGSFIRSSRDGLANLDAPGVLEDYANVAEGFLSLFQCTGEEKWLNEAGSIVEYIRTHFSDGDGGFFDTSHNAPVVTANARPRDPGDGATPSGWSATAHALLTYSALTGDATYRQDAIRALGIYGAVAARQPRWAGWGLAACEALLNGPREVAIVGNAGDHLTRALHVAALMSATRGAVIAVGRANDNSHAAALLHHRLEVNDGPAAYVCRNFNCLLPVTTPEELKKAMLKD